ncbi:hypothetical protein [Bdellovibrio bacteriovorus]|uniref:hypothetical protein n=1 Tax=Bdellovibrio bacteriovorus TaxID=959 RepID=UPI003AA7ECCA
MNDHFIEIAFPLKKSFQRVRYDEIKEVVFSDVGMSLSLHLKDGSKVPLGSTLCRTSGAFSVPELPATALQGHPGDRLRLKSEIESRMKMYFQSENF